MQKRPNKIVFLAIPLILYAGLIVGIATVMSGTIPNFLIFFIYVAGVPLLIIKFQKEGVRQRFGLSEAHPRIYPTVLITLVFLALISALICQLRASTGLRDSIILTIIIAPIGEEIFFRGYLQGNFEKFKGPDNSKRAAAIAVVFTAVLFSYAHFMRAETMPFLYFFGTFFMGLLFGYVMVLKRSIIFPILLHMMFNTAIIISQQSAVYFSVPVYLLIAILLTILLTIIVLRLLRPLILKIDQRFFRRPNVQHSLL